ncbi:MAG: ABC transporter permease subunit [Oscillospiraceae bacterium]|nr:ABC transporter permease subunit [Oscillospiraceae bacterium]MCL2278738.1 ABC transporter permease subunit [Oscillospiraceae bacterium]
MSKQENSHKNQSTGRKVGKSFLSMFKRLFVRDKLELNVLEEEAMRTPMKAVLIKLVNNKMAIIGFCMFVAVFLFSFVGSWLNPIDLFYVELTNRNIRPSQNILNYPAELADKNIVVIESGVSFSVALTDDGNLTVWGTECNTGWPGISDFILEVPEEIQNAHIVDIAVGMRFIVTLDDEGVFRGWGHAAHGQTEIPQMVETFMMFDGARDIAEILAGAMWSGVLSDNGFLYFWGSFQAEQNFIVPFEAQGRIVGVRAGDVNMILLLDDGTIMPMGVRGTEFINNVPPELMDGSVRVEDVVVTNRNVLALDEHGNLHIWGSSIDRLNRFPDGFVPERVVAIAAGYRNFVALKDTGEIVVWGGEELGVIDTPRNIEDKPVARIFGSSFQFYAVDEYNNILGAWGNRGYLFGSDDAGRDIFTRLMHGGRISLTVGIAAVIIATFIAIVVGLASGFFGGWVDHTLMRLADIFDGIPFLPLVITLSFVIGDAMTEMQRLYFIMILLGVLGWTGLARLIRAQILVEREKDFVLAARSLGIKQRHIMSRHILPNVFNFVIVSVTLSYATFILTEAALSFLGFGLREPIPSWGNMLTAAEDATVVQYFWWRWIIPGSFVVLAALSINLVGDALREAMDPKSEER